MQLARAARLILVGAPGVGKGTQTERLLERAPQLSALSSGELLRANVRRRTPLGVAAESRMAAGRLVPDSMMLRLIRNELVTRGWLRGGEVAAAPYVLRSVGADAELAGVLDGDDGAVREEDDNAIFNDAAPMTIPRAPLTPREAGYSDDPAASFILDGFPRNEEQASQLDQLIPMNFVVHLRTPTAIILDRIANRWVHEPSGRVYNTTFNAPRVSGQDDVTGEPLTRRADDDPEVWRVRLEGFERASLPLLEHYDKLGVLWTVEGNSSDEISPQLYKEFGKRFGLN